LRPRKLPKLHADRRNRSKPVNAILTTSDAKSVRIVEEQGEEAVAVEVEILTDDLPLLETGTMVDTVKLGPGVTLTLTFRLITAEVVGHLGPLRNLALDPRNSHPPAATAMRHANDTVNAVAAPQAIQPPRIDADVEDREGAVRTTVTVLDPLPAVMHPAHVPPEETAADETPLVPDLPLAPAVQEDPTGPVTATLDA
jgi:hypothetical protein